MWLDLVSCLAHPARLRAVRSVEASIRRWAYSVQSIVFEDR
jgi:hypothetical protein